MRYIILIITILFVLGAYASEYKYILDEKEIGFVREIAQRTIKDEEIELISESYGIILRFYIDNPYEEYLHLSQATINKLQSIQDFLAKTKNPVIIEVHAEEVKQKIGIKNWELSTVIANKIESFLLNQARVANYSRIKSIGYGEFAPIKNTPYNGGKYLNRVDIIILCNISGE